MKLKLYKSLPDGWLGYEEANFLEELVLSVNKLSGDLLEVGSWKGKSATVIGQAIRSTKSKLYCIDLWNTNKLEVLRDSIGTPDKKMFKLFTENISKFNLQEVIVPKIGSSALFISEWDVPLRFIFIDGDHQYTSVAHDTGWNELLVKDGVIAFHDYVGRGWDYVKPAVDLWYSSSKKFIEIGIVNSIKAFRKIEA